MAKCEVCDNDYDESFEVTVRGQTHVFDSFECAIHALAPICRHCGCRVIGHGVEAGTAIYCCAHCARQLGVEDLKDRVGSDKRFGPKKDRDRVEQASWESFPASDSPAY